MRIRIGFSADPNTDRDTAFLSMRTGYVSGSGSKVLITKNWKKKLQEMSSSLKRKHLALQNMNFLHFCGSFWPPGSGSSRTKWVRIRIRNTGDDSTDFWPPPLISGRPSSLFFPFLNNDLNYIWYLKRIDPDQHQIDEPGMVPDPDSLEMLDPDP